MPLINCKTELTLKWKTYWVLSVACTDNNKANSNNTVFTIKDKKLCVPVFTLSAEDYQKLSKLLSKRSENTTNEYRYFLKLNIFRVSRLFILVYWNRNNDVKRFKARRYSSPKGFIKNYNVIINGNSFYD